MVVDRVRQMVVLYSNDYMATGLGGLSIGRLRRVVVLQSYRGGRISRFDCILGGSSFVRVLFGTFPAI